MPVYHFIPEEETFRFRLLQRLGDCQQAIIASAFFTFGAFQSLKPALLDALANGAEIRFLLGRFDFVTEPKAVDALLHLSHKYPTQIDVYFDSDYTFHFKLAIFKVKDKEVAIIGSSNLTPKGLDTIGEVNLEIVGNHSVFKQAYELLQERFAQAVSADDAIDDYRYKYNRAKKYRRQRRRWENKGRKVWPQKRRTPLVYQEPQSTHFVFCWIGEHEQDKRLISKIRKEHDKAQSRGEKFPYQWVHVENRFGQRFKEGDYFVVCDNFSYNFGFAVCTRKFMFLDRHDSRKTIIFYRYRRGWKAQFNSRANSSFVYGYNRID